LAYGQYKWITYKEAVSKGVYILPRSRDLELEFEEDTSQHLVIFLKFLSKDLIHLASMIHLPQGSGK